MIAGLEEYAIVPLKHGCLNNAGVGWLGRERGWNF